MARRKWSAAIVCMAMAALAGSLRVSAGEAAPVPPLPDVNINVNTGYAPPPPGVHVYYDDGRPYYIKKGHRVYLEEDKKHKKHKKHDNGHGRKRGHHKDD